MKIRKSIMALAAVLFAVVSCDKDSNSGNTVEKTPSLKVTPAEPAAFAHTG